MRRHSALLAVFVLGMVVCGFVARGLHLPESTNAIHVDSDEIDRNDASPETVPDRAHHIEVSPFTDDPKPDIAPDPTAPDVGHASNFSSEQRMMDTVIPLSRVADFPSLQAALDRHLDAVAAGGVEIGDAGFHQLPGNGCIDCVHAHSLHLPSTDPMSNVHASSHGGSRDSASCIHDEWSVRGAKPVRNWLRCAGSVFGRCP
jgi:hypothetical protein